MNKLRYKRYDDQSYYVYLGPLIGSVTKMDDGTWKARHLQSRTNSVFHTRGEAAEWLRDAQRDT